MPIFRFSFSKTFWVDKNPTGHITVIISNYSSLFVNRYKLTNKLVDMARCKGMVEKRTSKGCMTCKQRRVKCDGMFDLYFFGTPPKISQVTNN